MSAMPNGENQRGRQSIVSEVAITVFAVLTTYYVFYYVLGDESGLGRWIWALFLGFALFLVAMNFLYPPGTEANEKSRVGEGFVIAVTLLAWGLMLFVREGRWFPLIIGAILFAVWLEDIWIYKRIWDDRRRVSRNDGRQA